ncbi:MAG: hypothetical protein RI907_3894 [Pseudomonadota bacterium]|jgi:hypothetical protein
MSSHTASIVSRVWRYLEQFTSRIFLKMPDEYSTPPYKRLVGMPPDYNWQSLPGKRGTSISRCVR